MRTAYAIAASAYERPKERVCKSDRRYSRYAEPLLHFFSRHRTALAGHVHRQFPHLFGTERGVRQHLQTLVEVGHLDVAEYQSPFRPNVYWITDLGFERCKEHVRNVPVSLPQRRRDSNGNHALHELLITETAVSVQESIRRCPDLEFLWEERFGFHRVPSFDELRPDYMFLFRCPQGLMMCPVEVFSGEDSTTRIREKMQKYAIWAETAAAENFLLTVYRHFGSPKPRPEFRLLCITQNRNLTRSDATRERQVLGATFCVPQLMQQRVWTTTNAALLTASIDGPIWHRAKDLVNVRAQWHDLPGRQQSRFLLTQLCDLQRYSLFPTRAPQKV